MFEYQEPEPMDFEYTSPPRSAFCRSSFYSKNERIFSPASLGSFPVPDSFFENKYNKSTAIANKVAEDFKSFKISDSVEGEVEHNKVENASTASVVPQSPKFNNANMALALYSPPLSPQQPTDKPAHPPVLGSFARRDSTTGGSTSSMHSGNSRTSSLHTSASPSFEQKEKYTPYTSLPKTKLTSKTIFDHVPNYNPSFIHSPHYTPSYTYYYERPTPVDPMAQSHGLLHFMQRLFRFLLSAAICSAGIYLIYRFGVNFSHDMIEKMHFYESESINARRECSTAYANNRCSEDVLVPAIVEMCREWERCIFQPVTTKRSRAFAETFAEMANGFSEILTPKTMFMSIIIGISLIWAITSIIMGHPKAHAEASSSKPSEKRTITSSSS